MVFYGFLRREGGLEQAESCLEMLEEVGVGELRDALADSSKFGLAKSFFMTGSGAGFDMDSENGIQAFVRSTLGQALPPKSQEPSVPEPKPKRKAARTTRKKNR